MEYYDKILFKVYRKCKAKFKINWYLFFILLPYLIFVGCYLYYIFKPSKIVFYVGFISFVIFIIVFIILISIFNKKKESIELEQLYEDKKRIIRFKNELKQYNIGKLRTNEIIKIIQKKVDNDDKNKDRIRNVSVTIFVLTAITMTVQAGAEILNLRVNKSNKMIDIEIKTYEEVGTIGKHYKELVKLINDSYFEYI